MDQRGRVWTGTIAAMTIACSTALASGAWQSPPSKVALTGARIIPVVGDEIAQGTILIEDGLITAIGTDVSIPYDAMEVDLSGKVIMPGLIDAQSWSGLDRANEGLPVMPFLDVADALDPSRLYFEDALRDGITTIHVIQGNNTVIGGMSRVVRPIGMTPAEMTVDTETAMKISISPMGGSDRMRQMATLRETFLGLDEYLGNLAERLYEEDLKDKGEDITVGPEEARKRGADLIEDKDYDDEHANLVRLRRGDFGAFVYCGTPMDVNSAIEIAEAQGFADQMVLVLGPTTYLAEAALKKADCPVILPDDLYHRERDPISGELKETFIARKIHDAGLMFALQPSPSSSMAERYLTYQAAQCVRHGIPRHVALEAITINPAKMLGLGDSLGSIEEGKVANLTVFSGDPLDFSSWVEHVYIDGILAYERSSDPRLLEITRLEGERDRRAEAAMAAESASDAPDADAESESNDGDGEGDTNGERSARRGPGR